jgi:hypothetical protein
MPKLLKKLIASLLLVVILFASFAPYAKAQEEVGPWYDQSFTQWAKKVFEEGNETEIFGERYTFAQVTWIFDSLAAMVIGSKVLKCIGVASENTVDQFTSCINALKPVGASQFLGNNGAIDSPSVALSNLSDSLSISYLPSGVKYFSNSLSRLHIIPEAKAQGFGFGSLSPLQKAWTATRNIAYALMVLVIVIIAFMIMFRVKISPQTVISIQSALPKVVVTILLITFSYAIVGLVVDLAYVIIGIIAMAAQTGGLSGAGSAAALFTQMLTANPIGALFLTFFIYVLIAVFVAGVAGGLLSGGTLVWGVILGGVLLVVLFAILMLYIAIRIFWTKLKAFVNVVLLITTGPFILLFGAISPAGGGLGTWLRSLAANLAVFPTIIVMGFLAHFFFWGFFSANDWIGGAMANISFLNPYSIDSSAVSPGIITVPGFGGDPSLVGFLVAFGILFLMPHAANIIKSMIEGKPFAYGTAIGEAVRPIAAPVGWVTGAAQKGLSGAFQEGITTAATTMWANRKRGSGSAVAKTGGAGGRGNRQV